MFMNADKIFILYNYSLKSCEYVVKSAARIQPNKVYFVRTQCNNFNSRQAKTLDQEITTDMETLKSWKISYEKKIYATEMKEESYRDNEEVIRLLMEAN